MSEQLANALTVDVEDYFHVSAFSNVINRQDWSGMKMRVIDNTNVLLDLFEEKGVIATFFVLGWVAEREPNLVKDISKRGHEIACHGYSHELVYNQTPQTFKEETSRAKKILENIVGEEVKGYRAASYSITQKSLWAIDILCDLGFLYDSSIFPVRHDRYGMPDSPRYPYKQNAIDGRTIVEFPLSSINLFGYQLPVAGGGYFRLFPYFFTKWAFNRINITSQKPFVFYLHPWEIDAAQPKVKASPLSSFRHYNNIKKCKGRLSSLLDDFKFTTAYDVLNNEGMFV